MKELALQSSVQPIQLNEHVGDLELRVESNSQVVVIDTNHRDSVEIRVEDNATLHYINVFSGEGTFKKQATVGTNSQMHWHTAWLGGNSTHNISTVHDGSGSESTHNGIFLGKERDRFTMDYWSKHNAQHTSGRIVVHGVLFDKSYADFKGNVIIPESGVDTDGSLEESTLLLGERARSDSVPQLEIDTNEVQAAHSSSITRIDDEQLFYLGSRGIEPDDAKRMIVRGFLEDIVGGFPDEEARTEVHTIIEQQLKRL